MKTKETYTVKDISKYLNVTEQTIRKKIKELEKEGVFYLGKDCSGKIILTKLDVSLLLAKYYKSVYNRFCKECGITERSTIVIPSKKGTIQRLVRSNGQEVFYIRNLPMGYDHNGKEIMYKSPKFTSRELAEQKRNEVIQQRLFNAQDTQNDTQKDETYYRIANMRFVDFCQEWIDKKDIRESTKVNYRNALAIIEKHIEDLLVANLSARAISIAIEPIDRLTPFVKVVIKGALEKLYKLEIIDKSMLDKIIYPTTRHRRPPKVALTEEQVRQVLDMARNSRYELLIHLLFKTGMRVNEAVALTWNDVEITNNRMLIHVTKTLSRDEDGLFTNIVPPKTKSGTRDVIVYDSHLVKLFNEKRKRSKTDVVFNGVRAKYANYAPILVAFKSIGNQIGEHLSPHVARHTYISIALAKGMDLYTLVEQVGHTDPNMILKVYGKRVVDKDEKLSKFSVI